MLAHGLGCDQNMWRIILDDVVVRCAVVLFDHIGAGRPDISAWSAQRYGSLDGDASDVIALCRALGRGRVGPRRALRQRVDRRAGCGPRPEAVLRSGPPDPVAPLHRGRRLSRRVQRRRHRPLESLDSNYLDWSGAMAPVIMGTPDRPELAQELADSFCRTDPLVARVFARATFLADNRADLAEVTSPGSSTASATVSTTTSRSLR